MSTQRLADWLYLRPAPYTHHKAGLSVDQAVTALDVMEKGQLGVLCRCDNGPDVTATRAALTNGKPMGEDVVAWTLRVAVVLSGALIAALPCRSSVAFLIQEMRWRRIGAQTRSANTAIISKKPATRSQLQQARLDQVTFQAAQALLRFP